MINRILIRIKVVQILYSYLLSRNEFIIEPAPEGGSRERKFAYSVYLDTLLLLQELTGLRTNFPDRKIRAFEVNPKLKINRVGAALAENPQLKAITFKEPSQLNALGDDLQKIAAQIEASQVFKDYSRKRLRDLDTDVKFWTTILETLIVKSPEILAAYRKNPDFSLAGLTRGIQMAVDTLQSYNDTRAMYLKAKTDLQTSLDKAYQLYMALFNLIVELTREQEDRLETAKAKYLATSHDLNPQTRFIDNEFARYLSESPELEAFAKDNDISWADDPALIKALLDSILASETYAKYMEQDHTDWQADCEFWRNVLRQIILPSDALAEALETKSIFWNDDIDIIGTFALKTIRRFATSDHGQGASFLPKFKDDEDAAFGAKLFTEAVENKDTYRQYIDKFINADWDPDRLAFMDIVIMIAAIAEILNFPAIPIPVTLNEYIEIANTYSTRRSGPFINGILFSVINMLASEGLLKKPFDITQNK